jgi:ABC-type multidrug transport system fused ATPase/permease subunit
MPLTGWSSEGARRPGQLAGAVRGYLATARPLGGLLWRTAPCLLLTSAGLALLGGLVPAANVIVVSDLLQALVDIGRASAGHTVSAGSRLVPLLVLLAILGLAAQGSERLGQVAIRLLGIKISNQVQMLIADKASAVDLECFEDHKFQNDMQTIADEAPYLPHQMVVELLGTITTVTTLTLVGPGRPAAVSRPQPVAVGPVRISAGGRGGRPG